MNVDSAEKLVCHLCAQEHERIPLAAGERALCIRCGNILAQGSLFPRDTALSFALTGLFLAVPAATLPFMTATKFGNEKVAVLFSGIAALWHWPMYLLAFWVLLCGGIVPFALLAALVAELLPAKLGRRSVYSEGLCRAIQALDHWAMPEVQVLAVLVAMIRLGSLVDVAFGPGFWCYCAMALAMLIAWRSYLYEDQGYGRQPALEAGSTG